MFQIGRGRWLAAAVGAFLWRMVFVATKNLGLSLCDMGGLLKGNKDIHSFRKENIRY